MVNITQRQLQMACSLVNFVLCKIDLFTCAEGNLYQGLEWIHSILTLDKFTSLPDHILRYVNTDQDTV